MEANGVAAAVKRIALGRFIVSERGQHRVLDILRLAELIGIPAQAEIVCPAGGDAPALAPAQPYAVIHAAPMFTYKRWTGDGWRALADGASGPRPRHGQYRRGKRSRLSR